MKKLQMVSPDAKRKAAAVPLQTWCCGSTGHCARRFNLIKVGWRRWTSLSFSCTTFLGAIFKKKKGSTKATFFTFTTFFPSSHYYFLFFYFWCGSLCKAKVTSSSTLFFWFSELQPVTGNCIFYPFWKKSFHMFRSGTYPQRCPGVVAGCPAPSRLSNRFMSLSSHTLSSHILWWPFFILLSPSSTVKKVRKPFSNFSFFVCNFCNSSYFNLFFSKKELPPFIVLICCSLRCNTAATGLGSQAHQGSFQNTPLRLSLCKAKVTSSTLWVFWFSELQVYFIFFSFWSGTFPQRQACWGRSLNFRRPRSGATTGAN